MEKKKRKIIVTGGSGYLGSHVRRYFGADDFSRRTGMDIRNPADARSIADYDVVIHMAALVDKRPEAASSVFAVNVGGTINLLENLRRDQVLIYCSTKDVYGSHIDQYKQVPENCSTEYSSQGAYEWSKLIGEKYAQYHAKRAGARLGIFRLSTVYGPASKDNPGGFVSHFARAVKNGEELRLKMRGEQVRDLLHVEDLARGFEHFIESDQKQSCYNIGGGPRNAVTLYELTQMLGRLAERSPKVVLTDEEVHEQIHYVTDISALERDLGWRPQYDLGIGLRTILAD
jgi:nucleoside-diphosphate-sugar epimerase